MKLLLFIVTILFLNSCGTVKPIDLIRLMNLGEENNETIEEANKYLDKKNIKHDESILLNDEMFGKNTPNKCKIDTALKGSSYIQVRIFDSTGNLYTAYTQCMGSFMENNFLNGFPPNKNNYPFFNKSLNFITNLDLMAISNKKKEEFILNNKSHSYTLVVYWNIWTKSFSKKVLKKVSKYKKKYGDKVYVILCNSAKDVKPSN